MTIPKINLLAAAGLALLTTNLNAENAAGAQIQLEKLPLVFNPNVGQVDQPVRFTSRGPGYSLYFTDHDAILLLAPGKDQRPKGAALRLSVSSSRDTSVAGIERLPGKTNYLIGNDPAKWHTGIAGYRKVAYRGVLPGIDLIYYGQGRQLEYDFRVSPGTDPRNIQISLDGAGWTARATSSGDLEIRNREGSVRFARPMAYQIAEDGSRETVAASYAIQDGKRFGFRLGGYDRHRELIIDPALVYSTYFGGSQHDFATGVAVDPSGNVYIAGYTSSPDLPTKSALQGTSPVASLGGTNTTGFVAKFDSTAQLVYATFLGGSTQGSDQSGSPSNGADQVNAIAVNSSGNAYLTGATNSTDFPLKNAVQATCGPAVNQDRFYCTTTAASTCSAGGVPDAFVTKLDPTGANLVYSTYLGGSSNDVGSGITVNSAGEAFVVGTTLSTTTYEFCAICRSSSVATSIGFPTTANAYLAAPVATDASCNATTPANAYAFLARLSTTGALEYSTYFGPSGSDSSSGPKQTYASGVALDSAGNVFVTGGTSDAAFPITSGAAPCVGCAAYPYYSSAWAAKFNTSNSGAAGLLYSTAIGGSTNATNGSGIAVDSLDAAYVTGSTLASDFPTTAGSLQPSQANVNFSSGFVTKLNSAGTQRVYSTYLGGNGNTYANAIAVDSAGGAVVTGQTQNGFSFPLVNPLYTTAYQSPFIVRMTPDGSGTSFSTYFGAYSNGGAAGTGIALDNSGDAYIAGYSNTVPTTAGSYSPCPNLNNCSTVGNSYLDAFVAKISGLGGSANTAPTANAGANQKLQCTGPTTPITLNGSLSSDTDGDALTFLWKDQNSNVLGSTAIVNTNSALGTFTYYLTVTDTANLSSNANTQVAVVDTTAPVLTLSKNTLTAVVPTATATSATVSLAGIASATDTCNPSPTITNNAPAQFPIGTTTVTFTATDHSGNQSAPQQLKVQVEYSFTGGFQAPLAPNGSYKIGRVIPVQFPLTAADGSVVTNAIATLQVFRVIGAGLQPVPVASAGNSNAGNQFRFDPTTMEYVYNLDTSSYTPGTYVLRVILSDQTTHDIQVTLS